MVELGRSDDVRKRNRSRILHVLRRNGPVSRKGISARTGLSASTVSAITSELIDETVIIATGRDDPTSLGRGRPQIRLALNPRAALVAAVMVQLDNISVCISDYCGERVADVDRAFRARRASPDGFRKALIEMVREALLKVPEGSGALKRMRLGVQGVTDVDGTSMLWSPITPHRDLAFKAYLEPVFSAPVQLSNDCSMIARALHWRAPDRFNNNYAAVLLSHGIGMGLMLNGDLVSGIRSSGTEFGHLSHIPDGALCRCGRRGCIEAYAGDYAIHRRAQATAETEAPRNDISYDEMDEVYRAALGGDQDAIAAYADAGRALGTGLADMYALVDSFPVAFVGRGTQAFEFIEEPLREAISATKLDVIADEIDIHCFPDEKPLILEGCTVTALLEVDEMFAHATQTREVEKNAV
ncbi:ROK family transcriptional regulator [Hoeflea prorocentri]|uniref:ROK family transcriptional regulator n=1 Tax=Hoeflea prorocentri TaxID=1922333 RepID=A0A9X3UII4_9HYPH|nr:ROK family transcriptional regulator [Hoeflea prorocentri]MCY6381294.1 ROK family transcriptional regulator [Hoeflea prorocentri]MDA5399094.1 ROK family transcriptional regulator [Hoeflea prorocentri]